jgi:tRNA-modifying protein YgfZ
MNDFAEYQRTLGATLANDGIALHYGDARREYRAAFEASVLMDRSHEGRIELTGRDRLAIPGRISTNDVGALKVGEGCATIFTNPNARILDRAVITYLGERALALTEPGRGAALQAYLQRNVFYNDEMRLRDLSGETRAFALHGVSADGVMESLAPGIAALPLFGSREFSIADAVVIAIRSKPVTGAAWVIVAPNSHVVAVHRAIHDAGRDAKLQLAGSLAYNMLRIHAGRPGVGRELSGDYIPLEVGLWDEMSFTKGCYTGQEIIARMESRGRLAKTMVRVRLSAPLDAPAELSADGKSAGTLTSAVKLSEEVAVGIAVVKMAAAQPGRVLQSGGVNVEIIGYAGVQPPGLRDEESSDG